MLLTQVRSSLHTSTAELPLPRGRGGARPGAGRKPSGPRPLVPHATRPRLTERDPILVTTRLVAGAPNLRRDVSLALLQRKLSEGADRFGFRLVEFSIQSNHLHAIAEADDARSLARGMQGLLVRLAKALNRAWARRGKVFADRYHARVLKTPRETRNALVYVLHNAKKHGASVLGVDAHSSGPWFRGWLDHMPRGSSPIARAGSWLLTAGWRRHGSIGTDERPASSAPG